MTEMPSAFRSPITYLVCGWFNVFEKFFLPIGSTLGLAFILWNCDLSAAVPRIDALLFL